jgi:hypothetical protein
MGAGSPAAPRHSRCIRAGATASALNWSAPERVFDLGSRADRARVYEVVLQEGRPVDILAYVDGALLVDLWEDMVFPRAIRSAWAPVINASRGMAA